MIPEGRFTIELPAVDGLRVRVCHGLEYPLTTFELNLAGKQGQKLDRRFVLSRGINMRAKGWMSVDTHVHNLTPLGASTKRRQLASRNHGSAQQSDLRHHQ
jgi:hypothetical protein